MIPRIIHQTWKTHQVPWYLKGYVRTWKKQNPGFAYKLYDDAECLEFVRSKYPDYLAAYEALPMPVERADFFRYLIVYDQGGVYADLDTSCHQPMERLMQPGVECVVGLEFDCEPNQYCQWVFLAAPKHPFLKAVCEELSRRAFDSSLSTLERTGPVLFTEMLQPFLGQPGVKLLPMSAFGAYQGGSNPTHFKRDVFVLHHFFGTWKGKGLGVRRHYWFSLFLIRLRAWFRKKKGR